MTDMTKMTKKTKRTAIGSSIFGGIVLLATVAVMVFIPTERRLWLEIGALVTGLVVSIWMVRFGVPARWQRWISLIALLLFIATWFALGTAGYAWFGGFLAGAAIGVAWAHATNRSRQPTISTRS
jgi:hypothetical protein